MTRSRTIDLLNKGGKATNPLDKIAAGDSLSDTDNVITEGDGILSEQNTQTDTACAVIHRLGNQKPCG